jgi:proteic killer suppression protein
MDIQFANKNLESLATDPQVNCGFAAPVVKSYRKRIQQISAATDVRDLYALRSLRCEKLKGKRKGEYSIRLNDQWRLILEFDSAETGNAARVRAIEDYH